MPEITQESQETGNLAASSQELNQDRGPQLMTDVNKKDFNPVLLGYLRVHVYLRSFLRSASQLYLRLAWDVLSDVFAGSLL